MTIELELGAADSEAFQHAFAGVPATVRRPPFDRGQPPPAYWVSHLKMGDDAASFWLARRGGAVVGRIGATLSPTRAETGYVGYFEAVDGGDPAVARALLEAALGWLRGRGATRAYGPIDRSTWYAYRFRVETRTADVMPADEEPFAWEPSQPQGYVDAFLAAGFVEAERYYSHGYRGVEGMRLKDAADLIRGAADFAVSQGFSFEPFSERWEEVLPDMYTVGNECFTKNLLFEPIAWEEFARLYEGVGTKVDYRTSFWLVDAGGKKRGMMFSFVDRGYAVMKTVGVAPELRRGGLSIALMWAACDRGLALGAQGTIGALIKTGNASEGLLRTGFAGATAWRHDYALYEKMLTV